MWVVGFKGWVKCIQFNPRKQKVCLKVFGLFDTDSATAYVYKLLPDFGSETVFTLQERKTCTVFYKNSQQKRT